VSQAVNIAKLSFAVKNLLTPFTREAEGLRKGAKKFDNLSDMVVVLPILGARLGVEEVIASNKLKYLT
jgi:hypothetical protein